MADKIMPGIGEKTRDQRRMADSERFVGQFRKTEIIAKDHLGNPKRFDVLAITQRKAPAEEVTGVLSGAFCRQYVIGEGLAGAGDTYLQGGTITGSNGGSVVIADYKTKDDADTPPLADAGDKLYLSCNVTATLANGVVQPGVLLNSATLTKTLPTAHVFSTAALTGVVFREIGRWTDTEFLPSGACGISTVTGCPGSFAIV